MERTIEQIVQEVADWSATTFPDDLLEDMMRKLDEEHGELHEAVATYVGPWSDLDGPFHPARACQIGDVRRHDLLDEIADNVFVLVRLASALGGDFREVIQNKWDIVRARDYSRQLEPEDGSNDHRTIIERLSDVWIVEVSGSRGTYYVGENEFSFCHFVRSPAVAKTFSSEEEADAFAETARFWVGVGFEEGHARLRDGFRVKTRKGDVAFDRYLRSEKEKLFSEDDGA